MSFRLISLPHGTSIFHRLAQPDFVGRPPQLHFGERLTLAHKMARTRHSVEQAATAIVSPANLPSAGRSLMLLPLAPAVTMRQALPLPQQMQSAPAEAQQEGVACAVACSSTQQTSDGYAMDMLTWYLRLALKAEQSAPIRS